jgi:hypothetical protein
MGADQISSDPEPDADDWDVAAEAEQITENENKAGIDLTEVAWDDVNAELEEFLAEGDSDDEDASVTGSGRVNENVDDAASVGGYVY